MATAETAGGQANWEKSSRPSGQGQSQLSCPYIYVTLGETKTSEDAAGYGRGETGGGGSSRETTMFAPGRLARPPVSPPRFIAITETGSGQANWEKMSRPLG